MIKVKCLHCLKYRSINTKGASAKWYQKIAPYCRKCTYVVNGTKPLSVEHKRKISLATRGKKLSDEHKAKLKANHKGRTGMPLSEDHKKKIGEKNSVHMMGHTPWNKGLKGFMAGEKHHNWKGGVTSRNDIERVLFRQSVQKAVFERDDCTCQICEEKGKIIHVDHIQKWSDYVELRFDINNCRTVCVDCHYFITFGKAKPIDSKWGLTFYKGGNKKFQ